jgi:hypothetical protein
LAPAVTPEIEARLENMAPREPFDFLARQQQAVRFQLPTRPIRAFRFDPATDNHGASIGELRLLTDRGQLLHTLSPVLLRPIEGGSRPQIISSRQVFVQGDNGRPPQLQLPWPLWQKHLHDAM